MKEPTYVETFPLTDAKLVCEIEAEQAIDFSQDFNNLEPTPRPLVPHSRVPIRTNVSFLSRVGSYIYQRVTGRKIVPFQPSPEKNPRYLLAYVEERLECGHTVTVYPIEGEHFTARKRSCHECAREMKKGPNKESQQAQRGRNAGKSIWPAIGFAFGCACLTAAFLYVNRPKVHILAAPDVYVRVLHQYDTYSFQLQEVDHGVAQQPAVWHFCRDFKPEIEAGFTLTQLKWIDADGCAEIGPSRVHHAYKIMRYYGTDWPVIPDNCVNPAEDEPVLCDGEPKFN